MTARQRTFAFVLASLLFVAARSEASTILIANITNAQEPGNIVPTLSTGGPRPASFGTAVFTLNDAQTSLSWTATIFNIDVTGSQTPDAFDNLLNAHIHAGATVAPGVNGSVVWGFFGSPLNDNAPNDFVLTPFTTGVGGTFSGKWDLLEGNGANVNLTTQLPFILSGRSYINFHTTQFTGGETRGALAVVPEPGTMLLVAGGLAVLVRRRFRAR